MTQEGNTCHVSLRTQVHAPHPCRKPGVAAHICNPGTRKTKLGRSLELLRGLGSQCKALSPKQSKVSTTKGDQREWLLGSKQCLRLAPDLHKEVHTHAYTPLLLVHKHVHTPTKIKMHLKERINELKTKSPMDKVIM